MSEFPAELKYANSHEWARLESDGIVVVGITNHAQDALGDVVFVELPELDIDLDHGDAFGVVESVKAVNDLYSPCAGIVVEVNEVLDESPELVNSDPYGEGWILKIKIDSSDALDHLMNAHAYGQHVDAGG